MTKSPSYPSYEVVGARAKACQASSYEAGSTNPSYDEVGSWTGNQSRIVVWVAEVSASG
jgi:hypothetical protein